MEDGQLDIRELKGAITTVNLTGLVEAAHMEALLYAWDNAKTRGFNKIEWFPQYAVLVEAGRDHAAQRMLTSGYDWIIQIDGDAAPLPADLVPRLVYDAFVRQPDADVVGAYCQLKAPSYLPTIDTGTGTWEVHYPGEGMLPVIRTGGHCFIAKAQAFRRFPPPWFRTRQAVAPARAMAELDNFARMKLDGRNPFADMLEWDTLLAEAKQQPAGTPSAVGEDSAFCDALRAAGGKIYVDTDIVAGHVSRKAIAWRDLKDGRDELHAVVRAYCGLFG